MFECFFIFTLSRQVLVNRSGEVARLVQAHALPDPDQSEAEDSEDEEQDCNCVLHMSLQSPPPDFNLRGLFS